MLSLNQQKVERLVDEGYSVCVTGNGGSGKSFFLRITIEKLRQRGNQCFVTAPTGIAATNIGGLTVHSFAGIGSGSNSANDLSATIKANQEVLARWEQCEVLVIDEVSMLSRELFEKLEMIARCLKKNAKPFGGIQLIFSGDFYQLRPVMQRDATASDKEVYCFASPMWNCCVDISVFFDENYRQHEPELIQLLEEFRMFRLSQHSRKFIEESLTRPLDCNPLDFVRLYSHRDNVSQANDECLALLPGEPHHYYSDDSGNVNSLKKCSAPKNLAVKLNARVVLLKYLRNGLVNGLCGTIHSFIDGFPYVVFDNGSCKLIREELFTVEEECTVVATRKQIPLDLSYAMTIHKSQGMAFPLLYVDLSAVFEAGQSYVAVSRATTIWFFVFEVFQQNTCNFEKFNSLL